MRYIELNPLRAQMVAHPADYAWSSSPHNAAGNTNPVITSHPLYRQHGKHMAPGNIREKCALTPLIIAILH